MKDIFLRASDLAKLTGHNRFNDIQETIDQILQKNQICDRYVPKSRTESCLAKLPPEEFKDIKHELCLPEKSSVQEVEAKVKQIVLKDSYSAQKIKQELRLPEESTVQEVVTQVEQSMQDSIAAQKIKQELRLPEESTVQEVVTQVEQSMLKDSYSAQISEGASKVQIEENLKDKSCLQVLESSLKQDLQMKRGNIKENDNLDQIQQKRGMSIGSRNSQMYVKELYSSDTYRILVRGMVDGISDDTLIETKNRTKRLFHELRNYERVQLEAYFFLTGLQKALLTEHYNDESNEIEYSRDEDFWCECVAKIRQFIETKIVINME